MNSCVRFIFNLRPRLSPLQTLDQFTSDDRRVLHRSHLHPTLQHPLSDSSSYLATDLRFINRARDVSCASSLDFNLPSCRTSIFQRSFLYSAASFWNSFSDNIKQSATITSFKQELFAHLRRAQPSQILQACVVVDRLPSPHLGQVRLGSPLLLSVLRHLRPYLILSYFCIVLFYYFCFFPLFFLRFCYQFNIQFILR